MKKSNPKEILFGYEKPINIKEQTEKYFRPLWHFHSEYEIVFIKESFGKKFIGDHIGEFKAGDLYFIGKQLPHMWVNDNSFFRKDIEIGNFEFDSYSVYEKKVYNSNDDFKNIYKRVYFCYFDEKQKKIFNQFLHYYRNLIMHGKESLAVEFIHNTAVITIQHEMY